MILLYHNVVPDSAPSGYKYSGLTLPLSQFQRQLNWLNKLFRIAPLADYLAEWQTLGQVPRRTIAITFDDGTATTFASVFPLLLERQIPITIFAATCHLNDGELMWGSYLNALVFEEIYDGVDVDELVFPLQTVAQRKQARRKLAALAQASGSPPDFCRALATRYPLPEALRRYYIGMTAAQLQQAGSSPLVEIAAHTVTHPDLSQQSVEVQTEEIVNSKRALAEWTGRPVRYFAYPSGSYNQSSLSIVAQAGFAAAFAVRSKRLGENPWLEIERDGIYSPSLLKLQLKAMGLGQLARRIRP